MAKHRRELSELTQLRYESVLSAYLTNKGTLRDYSKLKLSSRVVLMAALRHAGREDLAESISLPKRSRKDIEIPPEEELEQLEKVLWKSGEPSAAIILATLHLGLRSFEILNLQRTEVLHAVKSKVLRVLRKGAYEGNVAMGPKAVKALERLLQHGSRKRPQENWKIVAEAISFKGTHSAAYQVMRSSLRDFCVEAKLDPNAPHWLRHALATRMVRNGAPLNVVQKQLGHLSSTTTMRYLHASMSDVEKYVR